MKKRKVYKNKGYTHFDTRKPEYWKYINNIKNPPARLSPPHGTQLEQAEQKQYRKHRHFIDIHHVLAVRLPVINKNLQSQKRIRQPEMPEIFYQGKASFPFPMMC